jgi:hypothetical protein
MTKKELPGSPVRKERIGIAPGMQQAMRFCHMPLDERNPGLPSEVKILLKYNLR